ncbi:MAG: hypothetical protein JXL85_02620, partial [Bacilli bacterium]|nr:hypothetical protein [Bacilli bacterium]
RASIGLKLARANFEKSELELKLQLETSEDIQSQIGIKSYRIRELNKELDSDVVEFHSKMKRLQLEVDLSEVHLRNCPDVDRSRWKKYRKSAQEFLEKTREERFSNFGRENVSENLEGRLREVVLSPRKTPTLFSTPKKWEDLSSYLGIQVKDIKIYEDYLGEMVSCRCSKLTSESSIMFECPERLEFFLRDGVWPTQEFVSLVSSTGSFLEPGMRNGLKYNSSYSSIDSFNIKADSDIDVLLTKSAVVHLMDATGSGKTRQLMRLARQGVWVLFQDRGVSGMNFEQIFDKALEQDRLIPMDIVDTVQDFVTYYISSLEEDKLEILKDTILGSNEEIKKELNSSTTLGRQKQLIIRYLQNYVQLVLTVCQLEMLVDFRKRLSKNIGENLEELVALSKLKLVKEDSKLVSPKSIDANSNLPSFDMNASTAWLIYQENDWGMIELSKRILLFLNKGRMINYSALRIRAKMAVLKIRNSDTNARLVIGVDEANAASAKDREVFEKLVSEDKESSVSGRLKAIIYESVGMIDDVFKSIENPVERLQLEVELAKTRVGLAQNDDERKQAKISHALAMISLTEAKKDFPKTQIPVFESQLRSAELKLSESKKNVKQAKNDDDRA